MAAEVSMESEETKLHVPGPDAVDISPNNDKGILKTIETPGEGDASPGKGDKVFVHYTGKLTDGTKFDSSVDRGEMFEFTLGKGEVIKAWDIGVASMKKGEKCILVCHPDYAYGEKGSMPKIPPSATLVFEIELFKWQMEDVSPDNDKGILKSLIVEGEGYATPNEGATVDVHLIGSCAGTVFEERDVKFQIGEGYEEGIVEGLDVALKKFKKGERAKIILAPKYAFGEEGKPEMNIPSNSTVEYEVTLNSFEKGKESWSMTSEEKLEQSEIVKNKGTNYFKSGKFEMATKQYKKVVDYLQFDSEVPVEHKDRKNSLLLAGYLNLAACCLKLEKFEEVLKNCEKALELEPNNVKGMFRLGQAHLALNEYEVAKQDFERVIAVDGSNKAAHTNVHACNMHIRKELEKEKKLYKAMFQKMAEDNTKEPHIPLEAQSNGEGNEHLEKMETDDEKQAAAEAVNV